MHCERRGLTQPIGGVIASPLLIAATPPMIAVASAAVLFVDETIVSFNDEHLTK